jgi:hypothetical protein
VAKCGAGIGACWVGVRIRFNAVKCYLPNPAYAPQPNESFNADANIGHRFAILMANVGALRATRYGAG